MIKTSSVANLLRCLAVLVCSNAFPQAVVFRSAVDLKPKHLQNFHGSLSIVGEMVLFCANDYTIYAIDKKTFEPIWNTYVGWKSDSVLYPFKNTLLYGTASSGSTSIAQFDLLTGIKIQQLPFQEIVTQPHFVDDMMYATVLQDGGQLIAYDLGKNAMRWKKTTGHGVEKLPVYRHHKIIAGADDGSWFEIDYNGKFIAKPFKNHTYVDTVKVASETYLFCTHHGYKIDSKFLREMKFDDYAYDVKTGDGISVLLNEEQLLIIGPKKKNVKLVPFDALLPDVDSQDERHFKILSLQPAGIWCVVNQQLLHYDLKAGKFGRIIDLSKWNPHSVVVEGRAIWLISKNDGQLYSLDFEPDDQTAARIKVMAEHEREKNNPKPVDPAKVKAAKSAAEKLRRKQIER